MIRNFIRVLTKEFTGLLKQFKKLLCIMSIATVIAVVCMIGWNTVKFQRLQTSLQDVYFMEYGGWKTIIHKYDVAQRDTVTVAVLNGDYDDCKINRNENYIIGKFYSYETQTTVLMRYNLSDNTIDEITGKEAETIEEQIKEKENNLPKRSNLPEQVRKIISNRYIGWSTGGEKAVFCDDRHKKMYLYDVNTEKCVCIFKLGWNHCCGSYSGLDASGRYVFYDDGFIRLFSADDKIMIYDIQTGMKTKIFERKNTQNYFRFVQEMN